MKKAKVVLLMTLVSVMLLSGCGSDSSNIDSGEVNAADIGLDNTAAENTETTVETVEQTDDSVPPEEGMVRSKLTNEWIYAELADTRPIAVMFPINEVAQPQYGLSNVDIFYEIMEEGDMSRQMGIINDWENLEQIGNIRSIRDYFVYPALEWDSIIVHFGGPELYVSDILLRSDVENINGTGTAAMGSDYGAYYRIPKAGVASEHTAYTSSENLLAAVDKAGFSLTHRDTYYQPDHFQFASVSEPNTLESADGAEDATTIDMSKCFPVTDSSLTYNAEDGLYYKFLYVKEQVDAATKEQLAFANVIVQNTSYEVRDDHGYLYFQMHDTTKDGYYFTKGKVIHITWEKDGNNGVTSNYTPTKYYDDNGDEITLNTGKTMIFIVKDGDEVIYK